MVAFGDDSGSERSTGRVLRWYAINRGKGVSGNAAEGVRMILSTEQVHLHFGGIQALSDVSLTVRTGEILSIIGPNGAGKTSLLNCISGFYRPQSGRIFFADREISFLPAHRRAELGIARTFQNIELFKDMTVLENLLLGAHIHLKSGIFRGSIYKGWAQREEIQYREVAEEIIDFLEIEHIRYQIVGHLSYGLKKRVELGRALALNPQVLLLDEPMAGMTVEGKEDMVRFILDINDERETTIVLIEHDMGVVMDVSDRVAVLNFGELISEGTPEIVRNDPQVIEAYLGKTEPV